jgi:hemolysin activation/secretion protein
LFGGDLGVGGVTGWRFASLCVALTVCSSATALAQQPAPAPSQVVPPVIRPAPSVGTRIALPQVQAGGEIPAAAKSLYFVLVDVDVEGEFAEFVAKRQELAAPLIGKRISVADVFEFANKLQQLYVGAGFPLVRVVILPQELGKDARVKIRVIDGYVERIDATAIAAPVRGRVEAVISRLINHHHLRQSELERWLLLAGETPGLVLNAVFSAGKEVGGSVLVLTGRYRPFSVSLYHDNAMPDSYGTAQVVSTLAENGLAGFGEQFLVSVGGYPNWDFFDYYPTRRYLSAVLAAPIGIDGWRFELAATDGKTTPQHPLSPTFGLLDQTRAKLSYEAIKLRDLELIANARYETTDERIDTLAIAIPTPISLDRIRAVRGGMDMIWRRRESGTTMAAGWDFSRGLDAFGARTAEGAALAAAGGIPLPLSRQGADAVFSKLTGHLEINQTLPSDFFLAFMAFGQTSFGRPLLTSEQFDLVGAKMLSGFTAGQFPGDTAWVARGELGHPVALPLIEGRGPLIATPYLFAATGGRVLEQPTVLEIRSQRATNYGIGTRFNLAGLYDFSPDSYAFVEWSHSHVDLVIPPMPTDGNRIFAGVLISY